MAEPEDIGRPQHDELEMMGLRIGLEDQFLGGLVIAVAARAAARERHEQGRPGGLGIMLMLRCVDRIEYNDIGNQITLTKMLKKKA